MTHRAQGIHEEKRDEFPMSLKDESLSTLEVELGEGVLEGLPEFIDSVKAEIKKIALKRTAERLEVVKAALGSKAGIIGSSALTKETMEGDKRQIKTNKNDFLSDREKGREKRESDESFEGLAGIRPELLA
ncbi:MAG: hypothetical protein ACE5L7_01800 [Candidatus Aminicenantales bacterium]